jgi:hypothetical protein
MENTEHTPQEKYKNGGWGLFLILIAAVVGLMVALKLFLS